MIVLARRAATPRRRRDHSDDLASRSCCRSFVHLAALWEFLPKLPLLPGEAAEDCARSANDWRCGSRPRNRRRRRCPRPRRGAPAAVGSARAAVVAEAARTRRRLRAPPPSAAGLSRTAPSVPERPALPAPAPPVAPPAAAESAGRGRSLVVHRREAACTRRVRSLRRRRVARRMRFPSESDAARRDRIVAANLASLNAPTFGTEPKNSGGIFQIRSASDTTMRSSRSSAGTRTSAAGHRRRSK